MKILSKIIKEKLNYPEDKILNIQNVVMNTEEVISNSLFFAINKGNNYVKKALEKGASLVIADNPNYKDEKIVIVPNTVEFMCELAKTYRKNLKAKIIGITGSNGKTSTKDILYSILNDKFETKKTKGNLNNHIGLPFTILQLKETDEYGVFEMGMSDIGEIEFLSSIALPDYAIITNIGDSHLEFLKTRENVFKAKTEILNYVKPDNVIVYGDDIFLKTLKVIKVGFDEDNSDIISNYKISGNITKFSLNRVEYETQLMGKHNIINCSLAIVLAKKIGLSDKDIKKGIENVKVTPMRFERVEGFKYTYINDAYNASPISTICSLETFDNIEEKRYKLVVLGDMLELGEKSLEFHKEIIEYVLKIDVFKILLFGSIMKETISKYNLYHDKIKVFLDKNELIDEIERDDKDKLILLKGSRGMKLEEIIEKIEKFKENKILTIKEENREKRTKIDQNEGSDS